MEWIQKHQRFLIFFLTLWALAGALSIPSLPVALFPNVPFPSIKVEVNTIYQSPDQMTLTVTQPIEEALHGLPHIAHIKSTSATNGAEFALYFTWGTDMDLALVQVRSALSQILSNLPPSTQFQARRMPPAIDPILGLSLTASQTSLMELSRIALYQLRPLLASIPGVAKIQVLGNQEEEFQIIMDPDKLKHFNLTWKEVRDTLSQNFVNSAGGRIEDQKNLYLILSQTKVTTPDHLEKIPIKYSGNHIIFLRDIAHITHAPKRQWQTVRADGKQALLINIMQQNNANTLQIIQEAQKLIEEIKDKLPTDSVIVPYYDQSYIILNSALSVRDAIIIGALLAGFILWIFLRHQYAMYLISLLVTGTLCASFFLIKLVGLNLNVMTLGGMAAAVGLIVDDNVVVLENLMTYLKKDPKTLIPLTYYQTAQKPLTGSSLATIIIFTPLAFISGVTGGFFKELSLTMSITLSTSYLFVMLTMPTQGRFLQSHITTASHTSVIWLTRLYDYYKTWMHSCFQSFAPLVISLGVLIGLGYISFNSLGSGFLPPMDEGAFVLDYKAPPSTSVTQANLWVNQVENIIQDLPYVKSYARRMGLQMGGSLTEPNQGDISILLTHKQRPPIETIMADLQTKVEQAIPYLTVDTTQLMEDLIGDMTGNPQPIAIKRFSPSFQTLKRIAPQVAQHLTAIPGVVSIKNGLIKLGNTWTFVIDPIKSNILSSSPQEIARNLQSLVEGESLFQVLPHNYPVNIRLWSDYYQDQLNTILSHLFVGSTSVSSLSVGDKNLSNETWAITREDFSPMTVVTARIQGQDLGSTMQKVEQSLKTLTLPKDVRLSYGGLYQQQQESFYQLSIVFLGALLLLVALLLYLYGNYAIVISVISTILFSLPFVFIGLWCTHTELNISSLIGLTMVTGMIAEMSIFYFSDLKKGIPFTPNMLIESGLKRLRPILMSSLIGICALLPLALGQSMQTPLAISIIFGLIMALFMVLIYMPCIFFWLYSKNFLKNDVE